MNTFLVKYTAPLVLLFTLLSFTGLVSTAVSFTGEVAADACCAEEREKNNAPVDAGCSDIECRCASCAVSTLSSSRVYLLTVNEATPLWSLKPLLPSGHIQSIKYPPEFC